MFGFGKKQKKKSKELQASVEGKSKSQRIREEALANARAARETLGDDTIQKIAAAMAKKEQGAMGKAQNQLKNADADRIADELLYMLDEK